MELKDQIEQGLINQLVKNRMQHNIPDWMDRELERPTPSPWVKFKRIDARQRSFMARLIDMQTFFIEMTGKEPTKVIMGRMQQLELDSELRDMRMIMMPHKGWAGMLLGMNVFFVGGNRLEVTC